MANREDRSSSGSTDKDYSLDDLYFSPFPHTNAHNANGDASSSSDQSSPSNQDVLSPVASTGNGFGEAPSDPNSLFFDGASALSSFLNLGGMGLGSTGQQAGAVDGPWPAMSMAGFSMAGSPAVLNAASPAAQPFSSAGSSNRRLSSVGDAPNFWAASPGIPSPMGMDTSGADGIMQGLEGINEAANGRAESVRPGTEFDFGALVAEDKCGPSTAPSPQSGSASGSFSPGSSTSQAPSVPASSAFNFFGPLNIQNALSRFYPSFGSSTTAVPTSVSAASASANAPMSVEDFNMALALSSAPQATAGGFDNSQGNVAMNLDPAWFASTSLASQPSRAAEVMPGTLSDEGSPPPMSTKASTSQASSRAHSPVHSRPTAANNGRQQRATAGRRAAFTTGNVVPLTQSRRAAAPVPAPVEEPPSALTRPPSEVELLIPSVAKPPRDDPSKWGSPRLMILGIAKEGAKSRVETQVRISLVLLRGKQEVKLEGAEDVRGKMTEALIERATAVDGTLLKGDEAAQLERIGAWPHLKLPAFSAIKRKAKKLIKTGVPAEETLYLDVSVVRASEPFDQVFCCTSCQARERKRTQRKREARVRPAQEISSDEDAKNNADEEEKKKIVVFNSGEWCEFGTGEVTLPARITCYCRHVKEKKGFCLVVTLRDHADRVVASTTSAPIMITDDHKAAAAIAKASRNVSDAESSKASSTAMSRGPSLKKAAPEPAGNGVGKAPSSLRRSSGDASDGEGSRKRRAPYDVNQRGQPRPRPGHLSRSPSFAMTPLMTPLTTSKPGSPTQRLGHFPRTAPASLAPSPNRSDGLALPAQEVESAPESSSLDAVSEALAASQAALGQFPAPRPSGVAPLAGGHQRRASDGDVQMQDDASSTDLSPAVPDRSLSGASPAQSHSDSVDSFSSNTQSSATSMDIHNAANFGMSSGALPQFAGPHGAQVAQQLAAAAAAAAAAQSAAAVEQPPSGAISPQSAGSATSPGWGTETPRNNSGPAPRISRLIPAEGPMQGGIEITILGEGFYPGITCVFGDTPAVPTHLWSSNTLVCTLPPSTSPGPCVVSFRGVPITVHAGSGVQVFTYIDNSDQKLMELALQVVGLQMTGRIQDAKNVAMRIVGESGSSASPSGSSTSSSQGGNGSTTNLGLLAATLATAAGSIMSSPSQSRPGSRRGSFADLREAESSGEHHSFESIIVRFLTLLDFHDPEVATYEFADPISLPNSQGHTLLHLAVMLGFHKLVSYLLRHGIEVNSRDRNGFTPLHFAAMAGRVTISRMLLEADAGTYIRNCAARTALDLAKDRDQIDVVDLFNRFRSRSTDRGHQRSRSYSSVSSLANSRRSSFVGSVLSVATGDASASEHLESDDDVGADDWDDDEDDDDSDIERRISRTPSFASLAAAEASYSNKAQQEVPDAVPVSEDDDDEVDGLPLVARRPSQPTYAEKFIPRKIRKDLPEKSAAVFNKLGLTPTISGITYIPAYTMYGLSAFNPKTWRWSQPPAQQQRKRSSGSWRATYARGVPGEELSMDSLVPMFQEPTGDAPPAPSSSKTKVTKAQMQAKLARRLGYTPAVIDESVMDAFAYHDSKIRSLKKDKTLWLFWLPILLVALAYASYEGFLYIQPRIVEVIPRFGMERVTSWSRVY